jgi:di/tricarboxylate transporter
MGDALLVQAPQTEIDQLRGSDDMIILEEVEETSLRRHKAPLAIAVIAIVVGLAAFEVLPILVTALLGCLVLIVTRCISMEEAYAAIDWKVIFLLAGVLPLGIAMNNTGAAQFISGHVLGVVGPMGPVAVLAALYLLTAVLTETMSNNAAAVLLAPIAISTATAFGVDPKPFLMAVCFAASTSFATPVGYQTNTMIYNVGGYKFADFMKAGIPLNLIFWVLAVWFIPKFWPF